MPLRLNNKFIPDAHKKKDIIAKLTNQNFNNSYQQDILPKDSSIIPLIGLTNYSILLGYLENGEFQEWLDKRHVATMTADALHPETMLVDIILRAINMFPKPDILFDRLLDRLLDIRKTPKSNIEKTELPKKGNICSRIVTNAETPKKSD